MRFARKLVLLAIVAVTAFALSASSAFADTAVSIVNETSAEKCSTPTVSSHMVSGGCHIEVDGQEITLSGHIFGVESLALTCDNIFDIYVGANGTGYVTNMLVTQGGHMNEGCDEVRPCISEGTHAETHKSYTTPPLAAPTGNEAGEHAWPFKMERIAGDNYEGQVNTCFHTAESIEECEGILDFNVVEVSEDLLEAEPKQSTTGDTTDGGSLPEGAGQFSTHCEVNGHYELTEEAAQDLHIN